jgi:membrane fusion protein, multidrug efflux system
MTHRRGRAARLLGLGAPVALAAVLLAVRHAAAQPAAAPAPTPPGVPVQVAETARADVPVFVRGIGTAQAFQSVLVRARVDGTLDRINFTEGQEVKPGDVLAVIDPRPYQAALSQAMAKKTADEAQLANYRRDLLRYADLAKNQFASRQSVDTQGAQVLQGQANVQGDDAAIAQAQLNLGFTQITAPIAGRVGLRQVDVGNLIHASDQGGIVTITQIHPISVVFTLPQDALPEVQDAMAAGKPAVLAFSADGKRELSRGELLTPDNTIDTATGTIRLKANFANPDNRLWPGQFVNARLLLRTEAHALTVPSEAVERGPNGLYVYLVKPDKTVTMQPVKVGQDDGKVAVIHEGLSDGQSVVVAGQSRLSNGTRVAVQTAAGNT